MHDLLFFAIALLISGGCILVALSAYTWRRTETWASGLPVLLAASSIWVLSAAAEHLSPTLAGKILASKIQYLGILTLPPAAVCTILAYLGREKWLSPFLWFAVPNAVLCWGIVLTNEFHHKLWANIEFDDSGSMPLLSLTYGPAFWIITAVSHSQLVVAGGLFFASTYKNWRTETSLVLIGLTAPWIANLLYVSGFSPLPQLDLTPFGLIITGLCFAISFQSVGSVFSAVRLAHRDIVESIEDLILVVDARQRLISANRSARRILPAVPLPAPLKIMLEQHSELLACLQEDIQPHRRDLEMALDGRRVTFDVRSVDTAGEKEWNCATVYVLRDVTSERILESDLRGHRQQMRQIIDLIPFPIYARDAQGHFLFANDSCASAYGFRGEELTGRTMSELHGDGVEAERIKTNDLRVMDKLQPLETEELFYNGRNEARAYKTTKVPFRYDESDAIGIVALSVDVTDEREQQKMLHFLASTDPLTNLPNRRHFQSVLEKALNRATQSRERAALISLDLDHFKMINDSFGHQVGDDVLRQVADRLRKNLRFSDHLGSEAVESHHMTISRQGGDEFMVLLPHINEANDAAIVARRLIEALQSPFEVGSDRLQLGTSIGIAICPEDGENPEVLVQRCDQALSNAKRNLRGSFEFYNAELSASEERRHVLEQALRRAVDREEFSVHYQPIRDTQTNELCGAEALLRWESLELGTVAPDEFIPVAEEFGIVVRLGEIVLQSVCEQIQQWRNKGLNIPKLSVNLSARQLIDLNLQQQVEQIFQRTGVSGSDIQFELTEGSMLAESPRASEALEWLRRTGTTLALDDFGTGYSSLSLLRRLSFGTLKIDRSFVNGLGSEDADERLVRGVIALAQRLHIKTVAEGVETEEQLAILRSEGCDYIQGFLLGRPQPPEEFVSLLKPANTLLST